MEKLALIYEFNNRSPLFAQVAAVEVEKNHIERALEILENGIKIFPDYPTPYFIQGKALALTGKYEEAKACFEKGADLIECEETLNYYIDEMENIKRKNKFLSDMKKTTPALQAEFPPIIPESKQLAKPEDPDELDMLADSLKTAKIPSLEDSDKSDEFGLPGKENEETHEIKFQNKPIASDTLAGIYFAQGNFKQAIVIYELLLAGKPEKKEYYQNKIQEIQQIIDKK